MNSAQQITSDDIAARFKVQDAESPMDFIKKNLAAKQVQAEAPAPSTPYQPETFPEDPYDIPTSIETDPKVEGDTSKEDIEAEAESQDQVAAEGDTETEPPPVEKKKPTKEESLGNLRKKIEATAAEKEAIALEKQRLEEELANVKAGFVPNSKVEELEDKVKELEVYHQMVDFETSKEYREKYQTKLEELTNKARTIAQEYQIDPKLLDQALRINNKADRNKFLRHHMGDEVGAYEARLVLEEIQGTYNEAQEAKKNPKASLERLRQEALERETKDQAARIDNLIRTSKDSWKESLKEVEDLERYPELNFKPNDPEHNKIVAPVIEEAAREYGKFVKLLGAMGIKELPKEVQKMLAKTFKLSRAYAIANESRNQYAKLIEEVKGEVGRRNGILRPGVGGSMGGQSVKPQTGEKLPLEAKMDFLLDKVRKR